ncbi:tetratricopeptide repeat protein 5-like [Daphnia pulex]|uniref:tetratricopeptide repeat protein 5-like n=1 Tax=Daphnia pulex TaxID=6669 RepID=UPI001EDFCAE2|nr:tetratricopeptide repeat protein 5-like [Daphnia pulex]
MPEIITSLHEEVEKLYYLRDHYYDSSSSESSQDQKWDLVKKEMLAMVEKIKSTCLVNDVPSSTHPSVFQYLLGRAHNVMPHYDLEAQNYLSSAVKLNPSYVEAWNELGECFWKGGDTLSAKNCFSCALEKLRNKVSLRNLSIVLRQLKVTDSEERKKLLFEGLSLAKEAVQLDPTDGKSWLILGNAYFSVAFYSTHSDGYIHKALAAYGQAEKYEVKQRNFNTADLCFNKAMALFHDEKYQEALENLERSQKFEPDWELSKSKYEFTLQFLLNVKEMVTLKGKLKPRKLNSLLKSISSKDFGLYRTNSTFKRACLQDLVVGANKGKYIVAKVIASVSYDGGSPLACCISDKQDFAAIATIYRLSQDYGLTIGDSLLIPDPQMHTIHISFKGEVIDFPCVRVDSPQTILVNGHNLQPTQMASMFIKFSSA